jgi:hypothetical protein
MLEDFSLGLRRIWNRSHVVTARRQQVLHKAHSIGVIIYYEDSGQAPPQREIA